MLWDIQSTQKHKIFGRSWMKKWELNRTCYRLSRNILLLLPGHTQSKRGSMCKFFEIPIINCIVGVVFKCHMLETAYSKKKPAIFGSLKSEPQTLEKAESYGVHLSLHTFITSCSIYAFFRARWQLYTQAHCSLVHMKSLFAPQHVTAALKVGVVHIFSNLLVSTSCPWHELCASLRS